MSTATDNLLELEGLTKAYPGVLANDDVSLAVGRGEVHALLGENGAGKSTLVKMIYGVIAPDDGVMRFDGAPYAPHRPSDARRRGIGMVFQHFSLFEALTVRENIELGITPELAKGDLRSRIADVSAHYGLPLDPDRLVGDLSVGERQRVEVVRCLLQNPRLIIMDEPTSVLTPQEVDALFDTLRRLADEGCSILYISHKLEEIRSLCQHATILRGGRVVATCTPADESAKSLAEMMIGSVLVPPERLKTSPGDVRLRLDRLTLASSQPFGVDLADISLDVRAGEILGIAGVAGNGQDEFMAALMGEQLLERTDAIQLDGKPVGRLPPNARRKLGMNFVPEERLGHGAVPDMSLTQNVLLSARERRNLCRGGFIDFSAAAGFASSVVEEFDVRTAGITHAAGSLSGGNLQKFVVGREVLQDPAVLVAAQPTWGVDAGAAAAIHSSLLELAAAGAAILIISQDLDELLTISDRLAVLAGGHLTPANDVANVTVEGIGIAMGGTHSEGGAHA